MRITCAPSRTHALRYRERAGPLAAVAARWYPQPRDCSPDTIALARNLERARRVMLSLTSGRSTALPWIPVARAGRERLRALGAAIEVRVHPVVGRDDIGLEGSFVAGERRDTGGQQSPAQVLAQEYCCNGRRSGAASQSDTSMRTSDSRRPRAAQEGEPRRLLPRWRRRRRLGGRSSCASGSVSTAASALASFTAIPGASTMEIAAGPHVVLSAPHRQELRHSFCKASIGQLQRGQRRRHVARQRQLLARQRRRLSTSLSRMSSRDGATSWYSASSAACCDCNSVIRVSSNASWACASRNSHSSESRAFDCASAASSSTSRLVNCARKACVPLRASSNTKATATATAIATTAAMPRDLARAGGAADDDARDEPSPGAQQAMQHLKRSGEGIHSDDFQNG